MPSSSGNSSERGDFGSDGGRSLSHKALVLVIGAVAAGAAVAYFVRSRQNRRAVSRGREFLRNSAEELKDPSPFRPVRVPIRREIKEQTSFSNFHECLVTHMSLDLTVDFARKVLTGSVTLRTTVKQQGATFLVLDTNGLAVTDVKIRGIRSEYSFGPKHAAFGTALKITLPEGSRDVGTELDVEVTYETAPGDACSSVQWLPPEATAGKVHPYLFTQCQAIHARSMVPCQDAPCVKATYDATITVPAPLVALMSAVSKGSDSPTSSRTVFTFAQEVPMPAYLIALAVGDLESRDIGPRTRVWSEPSVVELAAYEFAETEDFLRTAEEICGPYVWGRYDLLMLPPSFPYGGMENPCLTFVTPTLLAGDRSLSNVVAHEISHSWSGNLVTNATWSDFWLNEGFTVFIERKIIAKMFGEKVASLKQTMGWDSLLRSIELFGEDHAFTKLHIPMENIDPDDSFSSVPYEKGNAFLRYLEDFVGGPALFDKFLKAYILRFQYGTVSWDQLKQFFTNYFLEHGIPESKLAEIDWNLWVHSPGVPPVQPKTDTSLIDAVEAAAKEWLTNGSCSSRLDSNWNSDQKVIFLQTMLEKADQVDIAMIDKLDARYNFTATRNSEILFKWCTLAIKAQDDRKYDLVVRFLSEQGRMKFVRPLYRELARGGPEANRVAKSAFEKLRPSYHAIAQKMIANDLGVGNNKK